MPARPAGGVSPAGATRSVPVRPAAVALRLGIALVVLLGLTLGVGLLLTRAKQGHAFEQRDAALVQWFADHRTALLDTLSGPAAELGNTWTVVGVGVVAAVVAGVLQRRWRPVVVPAGPLVGEGAIFPPAPGVIDGPRPPVAHLDAHLPPTSSFPSGHTAAAICLYGAIAAVVVAGARGRWRRWAPVVAVLLVLVVAAARLYRGAHYPTDVLTILVFAVPWLFTALPLLPVPARREKGVGEWAS